jgi:predicted permease
MRLLSYLRSVTARFAHPSQIADEMEEELRSHIQHRADDLERSGMDRAEAMRRARIEFGGEEGYKEQIHEVLGGNLIATLIQDARFALRVLRKSPGFTATAVLTLAMAIGANTIVFSVLNGLILRPVHVPRAENLYAIERVSDHSPMESYPNYIDLRDRNHSFDGLAAFAMAQAAVDQGKGPALAWGMEVSGNYFDVLGIQPQLGRFFHGTDEHGPNSAPYMVLSYSYWHSQFQGDRSVVGHVVQLNKHPFTIVGVAPPKFHGTLVFVYPHFFVPIVNQEQVEGWDNLDDRGKRLLLTTEGHLKAGVTPAQAAADLNSIGADLEKTYPKDNAKMTFLLARPGLFGDFIGRPVQGFLTGLMLLAALILLAACANLGSLFGARAADRSREVALRLALGSNRRRILRQLFTESVLVSLIGGAVGVWGSILLLHWLSLWEPFPGFPGYVPVQPDARVYGLALLLALASGFLFGAVPVKQVLGTDPYHIVKSGSLTPAGKRITARDWLIGLQIAICAVLVTSSFVAVRGLIRSLHSNFGFDPHNAMLVGTDLTMAGYKGESVRAMQKRMIEALQAIPGVQSVGLIDAVPLDNQNDVPVFSDKTTELTSANAAAPSVNSCSISPDYFEAAGTVLLSGRAFTWHDDNKAPRVAVVNQEFARKILGSENKAVGGYFKLRDGTRVQVVGMVEDGKYTTLTEDPQPAMFLPILQSPTSLTNLVVRSDRDPQPLAAAMKRALQNLDPGLPLTPIPWTSDLYTALFPSRVATVALGVLGAMGAVLAITGIFGMAAYSVSKRLRELGIRVALGAERKEILQAALGRAIKLLAFGSIAGLILGILASRVLAFIVYQATSRDPLVLAGVVMAMSLLGLVATWIPARRALKVDPLMLLKED